MVLINLTSTTGSGFLETDFDELKAALQSGTVTINTEAIQIGGTTITATPTELNYVSGVTSALQTQIDGKLSDVVDDTSPTLGGNLDCNSKDLNNVRQLNFDSVTVKPITSGAITATASYVQLVSESGSTDTLTDITGGSTADIIIMIASSGETITLNSTGNLIVSGSTYDLVGDTNVIAFIYSGVSWFELFRSEVSSGLTDPMTTRGDIIIRDATNTTNRLAVGGAGTVLGSDGTDVSWVAASTGTVDTSGTPVATDYAKFTDANTIEGRSASEAKTDLGFMTDLVDDTTPQLGGNLDIQAFNIEGAVAADFTKLAALTATSTELNYVDGVTSSIQTQLNAKIENVVEDTTPELGGELDCGSHTIGFTEVDNGNSSTADTIDWRNSNHQKSTLTGNCTYTFTAPTNPCSITLKLIQDATGSRTVTWPASVYWAGGTAPTLSTAANAVDIVAFYYDGTNYHGSLVVADSQ